MTSDPPPPDDSSTDATRPLGGEGSPPRRVGPYRIERLLGRGGMGVVYQAVQEHPLRRTVALKIVPRGVASEEVIARFATERQTLAVMDHPGIAQVFDAGATEDGLPYFVMELVDGRPITDFADELTLGLRQRIELFLDLCAAVQHAHLKGVVHRDLKPSNVLVARRDGGDEVKVIDFGIAKAVRGVAGGGPSVTREGQMIGTPQYMSPEQSGLADVDVDIRADVYSLGVLLYELLCGVLPFDLDGVREALLPAVVRDTDPPSPSRRLDAQVEGQEEVARLRSTTPAGLRRHLAGDLDRIVMKAMARDRDARYQTVLALAEDLHRYLEFRPVEARSPRLRYRVGRFVRRNRLAVGAAGVVGLALLAGTGAATLGLVRARAAEERARQEAVAAGEVSDFLIGLFEAPDPRSAAGDSVTAREVLDRGLARMRGGEAEELAEQPLTRARLSLAMGRTYFFLGDLEVARGLMEEAGELWAEHAGAAGPERARALTSLAQVHWRAGDLEAADSVAREALGIHGAGDLADPGESSRTLHVLGVVASGAGRTEEAESYLRRSLRMRAASAGEQSEAYALELNSLGVVYLESGRLVEAQEALEESLAIRRRHLASDDPALTSVLNNLAVLAFQRDDLEAADSLFRDALAVTEAAYGPDHPEVADVLNNLGTVARQRGDPSAALPLLARARDIWVGRLGPRHSDVAYALTNLANVHSDLEQWAEAESLYEEAVDIWREELEQPHPLVGRALAGLAELQLDTGRPERAEELLEEAAAIFRETLPEDHPDLDQVRTLLETVRQEG